VSYPIFVKMFFKKTVALFLISCCVTWVKAQSVRTINDPWTNHILDRFAVTQGFDSLQTSIKYYLRSEVAHAAQKVQPKSKADEYNASWLLKDNWDYIPTSTPDREKNFLKYFYTHDNAWFSVNQPDFQLIVNPLLGFSGGIDTETGEGLYRNTRGGQMRGMIGKKVGFYSMVTENQFRFPDYYRNQIQENSAVPGAGFYKSFGVNGTDFLQARGYVSVNPIKQINVQFGHDRNFIGNGHRSLIISDFSKEHLFLKLQTSVWRIHYVNLFSEQVSLDFLDGAGGGQSKKYEALHYLNIALVPGKFHLGLFERVVFSRQDSGQVQGFETNYLNPVIFYRSVEHGLNSSDNALLGLDWKWNVLRTGQVYGQVVLDEFNKNLLTDEPNWWGNKWAFQAGVKYFNLAGIQNLDVQVETNWVRPYTFTHYKRDQNVVHFNQPLTHPIGTNFREFLGIIRYQPLPKLRAELRYFNILQGVDSSVMADVTFGGDVLNDNVTRSNDFDVVFFHGLKRQLNMFQLDLSYQVFHRLFFDVRYFYRSEQVDSPRKSYENQMLFLGFRMHVGQQNYDF
jgi:hypothetical protein